MKPIDKVTIEYLDAALRICDIKLSLDLLDKILDLVELIEESGGEVSLKDVLILQASWNDL